MVEPVQVSCSHCGAKLKLKSSAALGKKIGCPKCKKPFVAKAAAGDGDDVDLFGDLPMDDYRAPGEEEEDEAPVATKKGSAKGSGKVAKPKRKKKGEDSNVGGMLLTVLVVLVGIGVIGGGGYALFSMLPGGTGGIASYLPAETDTVIHVQVANLLSAPVVAPLLSDPKFKEGMETMTKTVGLALTDIESVTVGAVGAINGIQKPNGPIGYRPPQVDRFVAVVKTKAPVSMDKIKAALPVPPTSANHNGQDYLTAQNSGKVLGFCSPAENTVLIAPEAELKAAIDSKGAAPARSRYRFVDLSQQVVLAFGPQDLSVFRTQLGMEFFEESGADKARKATEANLVTGASWGLLIKDNITVRQDVRYNASSTAKNSVTAHQTELSELKTNVGFLKGQATMLTLAAPAAAGPAGKIVEQIVRGVEGGTVVATGATVSTQVTFAGSIVTDAKELASAAAAGMGGGGMGGFPSPGLPGPGFSSPGLDPTAGFPPGSQFPTPPISADGVPTVPVGAPPTIPTGPAPGVPGSPPGAPASPPGAPGSPPGAPGSPPGAPANPPAAAPPP